MPFGELECRMRDRFVMINTQSVPATTIGVKVLRDSVQDDHGRAGLLGDVALAFACESIGAGGG